jgi:hypothetical protein
LSIRTPSSITVSSGAYLNVVADAHAAELRHLDPACRRHRIAESVGPDHGTGVNNPSQTELDVANQRNVGDQPTVFGNAAVWTDDGAWSHVDIVANN